MVISLFPLFERDFILFLIGILWWSDEITLYGVVSMLYCNEVHLAIRLLYI